MGRMGELYIQIMEANEGSYPEDLTLYQAAEMNKLKIYNKEEYEKWKKEHPQDGETSAQINPDGEKTKEDS